MKISKKTRFPYPVLNSHTTDYKRGEFSIALRVEEFPNSGKLNVKYDIVLEESTLLHLIESKSARLGVFVTCLDTFYNKNIMLDWLNGSLEFPAGTLRGSTVVRPFVCAEKKINNYQNDNLNDEYVKQRLEFEKGSLLAIGNELVINVGREKLAPMESIFSLAVNVDIHDGEIRVQTASDTITIYCSPETYKMINGLRQTHNGRSILLNSVYLPVVMEVLSHLREDAPSFADKKWFKVFNAKCEHLGIEYSNSNFLEDAQKLLKSPINRLKSVGEDL